jgi:hypothetical protein
MDKRVADRVVAMPEKHSYLFGQIMWVGFRRAVVPYTRGARASGRSMWTLSKKVKYFIDAFTAFSYLPVRAASVAASCSPGSASRTHSWSSWPACAAASRSAASPR